VGDTTLILVRSGFLLGAVIWFPSGAVLAYAVGTLVGVFIVAGIYYGFFHGHLGKRELPFKSIKEFMPNYKVRKERFL
jgi:O-antigen/teichoic acid export membrane protein